MIEQSGALRIHRGVFALLAAVVFATLGRTHIAAQGSSGAEGPSISVDRTALHYGALRGRDRRIKTTPDQIVFVDPVGADRVPFRASADRPWLSVDSSGFAPTRLIVGIRPGQIPRNPGTESGAVLLVVGSGGREDRTSIQVTLNLMEGDSAPPLGSWDAPIGYIRLENSSLPLMGSALDDIGVTGVEICEGVADLSRRRPCADGRGAFLGRADIRQPGRQDLEALFSTMPMSSAAAWIFWLDPKMVEVEAGDSTRIYAVATDVEGHWKEIGSRPALAVPADRTSHPVAPSMLIFGAAIVAFVSCQFWLRARLRRRSPPIAPAPAGSRQDTQVRPIEIALLIALMAAFIAFASRGLGRGLEYDELYSAWAFIVGHPLADAATKMVMFNNHIAFSLLAGLSIRAFGPSEWALRLPSLTLGAATLWAAWLFARLLSDRATAVVTAGVLAACPFFFEWTRRARGYAGLTFACVLSGYAFFAILRRPSKRLAWLHGAATALAVYFNLYGIWTLGVQYALFIGAVLRARPDDHPAALRMLWYSFFGAGAVLAIAYLPVFNDLFMAAAFAGRGPVVPGFPVELARSFLASDSIAVAVVIGALCAAGLTWSGPRERSYLVLTIVAPVVATWLIARPASYFPRFFAFWTPLFAYLVGSGAVALSTRVAARRPVNLPAAAMAIAGAVPVAWIMTIWIPQDLEPLADGYRELLKQAPSSLNNPVYGVGGDAEMFAYYFPHEFRMVRSPREADLILHDVPRFDVAYHEMSWNTESDREIFDMLKRRCAIVHSDGTVVMFSCGSVQ